MKDTIESIIEWHEQTFSNATLEGQEQKWQDERKEWEDALYGSRYKLEELADMVIVCCGIMRFDYTKGFCYLTSTLCKIGATDFNGTDLWNAVEKKMQINRQRKWSIGKGNYQHVGE